MAKRGQEECAKRRGVPGWLERFAAELADALHVAALVECTESDYARKHGGKVVPIA